MISISFEIELLTTFVRRMNIFFARDANFANDNYDVLDSWLRVVLNLKFVEKCEIRSENESNDDHDECWFSRDKAIDANIQKSIDCVIDISRRIRFIRHDFVAIRRYRSMIATKSRDVTKVAKVAVSRND